MNKFTLSALALSVSAILVGCNDGSGFTSTQSEAEQSTQVTPAAGESALRNMSQDKGAEIEAVLAEGVTSPDGEQVGNLIDGNHSSKFLAFDKKATVIFKAAKAAALQKYHFVSANDEPKRDPKNWVVYGSNDKQEWVEIDSRANEAFTGRAELKAYELEGEQAAYQYFKFDLEHGGTDSYGADITQLAELELIVIAEAPIVSFGASNLTPEVGELVVFEDTSLVNPTSWQWTFEGGTPATSTERKPLVRFNELGAKTVTLVAKNDKGESELVKTDFIRVWDPASPWAGFPKPTVTFTKNKPEHPGQAVLERVMPDLEAEIHRISELIAKRLFNNVTEINVFESVEFITDEYDFPAAKGGTDKNMQLMFDLNHIANLEGKGDQAIRDEIIGVLWHELTHGYQNVPNSGAYIQGTDYHSYLEGMANFIRLEAGYLDRVREGRSWLADVNDDAYNQTSLFLEWVVNTNRNIDFMKAFNASAKTIPEWSFEAAFEQIFGENRGLNVVLGEYQAYLKSLGIVPPNPTPVEGYSNILQLEGVSMITNATHLGPYGDVPENTFDNSVYTPFTGVIEAPWFIEQYTPHQLPINEIDAVEVDFALANEETVSQYSIAMSDKNEIRWPTSWQVFGSNNGETWTLIDEQTFTGIPELLTTYTYELEKPVDVQHVRFSFKNERQGDGIGGDNGRLVQIGEIAIWTQD
ncbi:basic secretory protein-like protein [Pseudoalteromonas phenolica]|uniref:PKD domain-containing protein n=1 Tax=Pseudoalteromonas phenolica TaxID=161398 RepID=A0A0S2K787_9GAMM|nr:basic secretory protein-like protein [Pseudoalteromonas phenolica]ALO44279.1 PKD domain-containing protein [Pseudoalteromonas phenolica]MBE0357276.1 hypothetical protein [Pseudoalteromonas phenolica O-BC30]RXE94519.1 hypothetical protein D9981_19130 [Pseudoalteromonas phenolica O-BC30]